jgi:hypothetical protein
LIHRSLKSSAGFRVQVKGNVAIASDPFKVPTGKAGDDQEAGDARREQSAVSAAEPDSAGTTRVLEHDDQPFPWEMATAVSNQVFEDGIHEFLVEVGGPGLLGFCPASFIEQRTRIGKHWMNEDNFDRTWALHSTGTFANGNVCSESERNARFTAGDRILIRLNLFQVMCIEPIFMLPRIPLCIRTIPHDSEIDDTHCYALCFVGRNSGCAFLFRMLAKMTRLDCTGTQIEHWLSCRITQETAEYFRSPCVPFFVDNIFMSISPRS